MIKQWHKQNYLYILKSWSENYIFWIIIQLFLNPILKTLIKLSFCYFYYFYDDDDDDNDDDDDGKNRTERESKKKRKGDR